MPETIEAFVAKLQEEGVRAGQAQAEKLIAQARSQADGIVQEAQEKADKLVSDANAKAENLLSRAQTDMALAARDTVGRLRETLNDALNNVLNQGTKAALDDQDFLAETIKKVIEAGATEVTVSDELKNKLAEGALADLTGKVDLLGTLSQAGFEFRKDGGAVEVTLESVVEQLCSMVTPILRDTLDKAAKQD